MEENSMISIIIPVYKVEKYLDRCVQSVVDQTYKNLEIILVDDGSPDNCPNICDKWKNKDSRVRVIHKKNGGLSDARNAGIEIATGKYIAFVDSDDYIKPEMYEKLYFAINEYKADMAICNLQCVDDEGNLIDKNIQRLPIKKEVISGREIVANQIWKEKGWYWIVVWSRLYSRKLFEYIRFPVEKLHEDEFTAHLFWSACEKVACVEGIYYNYVQRSESITNEHYSIRRLDSIEAILMRLDYMLDNNYSEKSIHNCYNLYYSVLIESYKKVSVKEKMVKKRYKELQCFYKKIFWKLIKKKQGILRKSRYILNYISPYYGNKLINTIEYKKVKK